MPKKWILYISAAILLVSLSAYSFQQYQLGDGASMNKEKNQVLTNLFIKGLQNSHFRDVDVNNEFSKKAYDLYLERLDFSKRFLTRQDVQTLSRWEIRIDDQVKKGSFKFFDTSVKILNKRIKKAKNIYQKILAEPFDFTKNTRYETNHDKREYPANVEDMRKHWHRYLKYRTLRKLTNKLDIKGKTQEGNTEDLANSESMDSLEKEARKSVLNSHKDWFNRMDKLEREDRFNMYINALASSFDPHTAYLPPKDKENFDIQMSGQLEGIGAQLYEKNGYIKVKRIVPGSASWRQGDLEAGDKILKVAQKGKEPVDVVEMRLDKVVQKIRGKKGSVVVLTVEKMDGSIEEVPIERDVVNLEQTYAKSAMLQEAGTDESVGYIKLPKFYADFDNEKGGRNASEDVKRELKKMKQKGMDGLVLDLRQNGGGSLKDAIDIAGLFIKKGPVVQVKGRKGAPRILKDEDPQVYYDGPLVILVNAYSASASEILSAAMQDYERGVVVGTRNTYGKGTVQRMINLDRFIPEPYKEFKPFGSLKLTMQKFYRIDGGATQLKGVKPDILLPGAHSQIKNIGERELDYPMQWSQISAADYELSTLSSFNIQDLNNKSKERINDDRIFNLLKAKADFRKEQKKKSEYSLNLQAYQNYLNNRKERSNKFKDIRQPLEEFQIGPAEKLEVSSREDTVQMERQNKFHNKIKKDPHLFEALRIAQDIET